MPQPHRCGIACVTLVYAINSIYVRVVSTIISVALETDSLGWLGRGIAYRVMLGSVRNPTILLVMPHTSVLRWYPLGRTPEHEYNANNQQTKLEETVTSRSER